MKFSQVAKGTRAERPITVPGYKVIDPVTQAEKSFVVIVRPLSGLEQETAFANARMRAIEKGVPDPKFGEPIYDLAVMAFVLAVGCVDPDSPENARTHTFKDGIEILEELHPEMIVFLHEHHETWQSETSPFEQGGMGDKSLMEKVREVAGPDGYATFMRWSPRMRLTYVLFTARMLWDSLGHKFLSSSDSENTSTTSESETNETNPQNSNP